MTLTFLRFQNISTAKKDHGRCIKTVEAEAPEAPFFIVVEAELEAVKTKLMEAAKVKSMEAEAVIFYCFYRNRCCWIFDDFCFRSYIKVLPIINWLISIRLI